MKFIRLLCLLLILFILGGFFTYKVLFEPKGIEIDHKKYPITGIDICEYTGDVDFQMARKSGLRFVIMRSSYGNNYDKKFADNFKNAKSCNLPIGVYHGFNFKVDWKLQCVHFLSATKGKNVDLYYFLNVEDWSPPTFKPTDEKIRDIQNFVNYFESKSGKKLMFYSNLDGFKKYLKSKFAKKTLWICSFSKNFKEPSGWIFWQYYQGGEGDFPYAKGCVDLNTYNGDLNDWYEFLKSRNFQENK